MELNNYKIVLHSMIIDVNAVKCAWARARSRSMTNNAISVERWTWVVGGVPTLPHLDKWDSLSRCWWRIVLRNVRQSAAHKEIYVHALRHCAWRKIGETHDQLNARRDWGKRSGKLIKIYLVEHDSVAKMAPAVWRSQCDRNQATHK